MIRKPDPQTRPGPPRQRRALRLAVLALAVGAQAGCGREFFREWANQDVSEAVFEKSRDPRWRLDMFSVEPPALSRFADPYDPDRPPAPPDDYASQSLSPVPQWPDNRLLVPAEGTGYLDMLEAWQRDRPASRAGAGGPTGPDAPTPRVVPSTPPAPGTPSPFDPATGAGGAENSGPNGRALTPIPVPDSRTPNPDPATPDAAATDPGQAQARDRGRDRARDAAVRIAAFQESGLPMPVPTPAVTPIPAAPPSGDIKPPLVGDDPGQPGGGSDLSAPVNPRPDLRRDQRLASEAMASELSGILVPGAVNFNQAEAAGLPRQSDPYVITLEQAFTLALLNSRVYQFQLENVYGASLAVTLQRFTFTPQFYAGLSPPTGVLGTGGAGSGSFASANPANVFNYATRETGAPVSTLSIGTVAGFGKVFSSGARLIAGFANSVVFNFIGKNSFQPTVRSALPLTLVQPLLRGGGRAVTLEQLTQVERNLLYQIRAFAKFRQEFVVASLAGGQIPQFGSAVALQGFSGGGNNDPTVGFLNLLEDVQLVENARRNVAAFQQIVTVYRELINGEASGLSKLQLDQVDAQLQQARQTYVILRTTYRGDLDGFKLQMGLPPDTPLIPNRSITSRFNAVYEAVDRWQGNPRHELSDLPQFARQLPNLEDVKIDGRSVLGVYGEGKNDEDQLEELLLAGERTALEHRLDLMNFRAQLYDSWRQIKVAANALQGVLNVSLTNQFVTPPGNTNPFGFVDQAKQFSLAIQTELPLVRLAERNTFRANLINYQRQRRSLQNSEDAIKLNIRNDIRAMQQYYLTYEIARRNFVLQISVKDQAFEQIIAPPAAGAATQGAVQTNNLIQGQSQLINVENQLIQTWYNFQVARLSLYRDLGILPFDEWEAFHELFPAEPLERLAGGAPAGGEGPARLAASLPRPEAAGGGR